MQINDIVSDDDVIVCCSDERTDSEYCRISCRAGHVHDVILNEATFIALENVDGVVVGLVVVGVDDGVATKHDAVVECEVNRLERLIFKVTTLNEYIFVKQVHVLSLQVKSDATVDELAAHKLCVVVDDAVADSLMRCSGKQVELHYREYNGALPWRGMQRYVVDSIVCVSPSQPQNTIPIVSDGNYSEI